MRTAPSPPAVTMRVPSALNAALPRGAPARRRAIRLPVRPSRMRAVPSSLAVIRIPLGAERRRHRFRHDRAGHADCARCDVPQTRAVRSSLAVTMRVPSGLKAALVDAPRCPRKRRRMWPVRPSQTSAVPASVPVAISRPRGLNATPRARRPSRAARGGRGRRRGRPGGRVSSRRRLPSRRAPPELERGTRDRRPWPRST